MTIPFGRPFLAQQGLLTSGSEYSLETPLKVKRWSKGVAAVMLHSNVFCCCFLQKHGLIGLSIIVA